MNRKFFSVGLTFGIAILEFLHFTSISNYWFQIQSFSIERRGVVLFIFISFLLEFLLFIFLIEMFYKIPTQVKWLHYKISPIGVFDFFIKRQIQNRA